MLRLSSAVIPFLVLSSVSGKLTYPIGPAIFAEAVQTAAEQYLNLFHDYHNGDEPLELHSRSLGCRLLLTVTMKLIK